MRILLFTHYFPPETGAPAAREYENAKFWVKLGHSVTVITGFPNYPTGVIPQKYRGKIFQKEYIDGIKVLRTWTYPSPNRGFKKRAFNFLVSMITSIIVGINPLIRVDVIIGTSPQLLTPLAAYIVSKIKRKPFVFEVRDLWPQAIVELGLVQKGLVIDWLKKIELFLYNKAAKIVVVTRAFKEYIRQQSNRAKDIFVIPNGIVVQLFSKKVEPQTIRDKLKLNNKFLVLYCGNHGMSQNLMVVLEAAQQLRAQSEIVFLLIGDGPEKDTLVKYAQINNLENVIFLPSQSRELILCYYAAADVCLVPLKNLDVLNNVIPSKIFEIMASRKPVIASLAGEAEQIINAAGAGIVVPPGDAPALSSAIIRLYCDRNLAQRLGDLGQDYVLKHFNRAEQAKQYIEILETLLLPQKI